MKWIGYVAATALLAVGCNVFGGDPYEEAIEYINELEASFAKSAEFWQEFYDINEAHSAIFVPKCTSPRYGSMLGPSLRVGFSGECGLAVQWVGIPVKWNSVSGDLEHGFRRSGTLVGA